MSFLNMIGAWAEFRTEDICNTFEEDIQWSCLIYQLYIIFYISRAPSPWTSTSFSLILAFLRSARPSAGDLCNHHRVCLLDSIFIFGILHIFGRVSWTQKCIILTFIEVSLLNTTIDSVFLPALWSSIRKCYLFIWSFQWKSPFNFVLSILIEFLHQFMLIIFSPIHFIAAQSPSSAFYMIYLQILIVFSFTTTIP